MHEVYNPTIPRLEKKAHWQKLLASWRKSHLPMQEFCSREQIKMADLKRWLYRLGRDKKSVPMPVPRALPAFTPLQLISEVTKPLNHQDNSIELIVNHYRIRCGACFSEETLLRLLHTLRQVSSC